MAPKFTTHPFTDVIKQILSDEFGPVIAPSLFAESQLLQYLNVKTKSASRGSKARGAFANHYATYVLVEDYLAKGFDKSGEYDKYDGRRFTDLFKRQRELPFGSKLQNHGLNGRMNDEFRKYFPTCEYIPILRNNERYWINENLLRLTIAGNTVNIASAVIRIIDAYVEAKRDAFETFITACQQLQEVQKDDPIAVHRFISDLLKPNVDARVFEIVSFAILKEHYARQSIFWGMTLDTVLEDYLILYKTGRCNANDGGIDFVMRPLGRFFQVTETTDVRKYFLDIDKVQRFPITFVVKSNDSVEQLRLAIREQARRSYGVDKVVNRYMQCVEEIINIPLLLERLNVETELGKLAPVIDEIERQSKVEFNYEEEGDEQVDSEAN